MRVLRRVLVRPAAMVATVVLALGIAGPLGSAPPAAAAAAVNGGGSGFAGLEIQQWQADTARKPYNLTVNYSSQSSGVGRQDFANGLYDYGVSDVIYQPGEGEQALLNQLQAGRCGGQSFATCARYVPISAGGLSFMYNVVLGANRYTSLQLTPTQVCGIFTQNPLYHTWNQLVTPTTNQQLASDTSPITVVTRQDSAGESYVLSQYCIAEAPGIWGQFLAAQQANHDQPNQYLQSGQPISEWPSPVNPSINANDPQASGADAVADFVADPNGGANSITYDAAGYALVRSFPVASVQNKAGVYQQPNAINVNVALQYATGRGDGTFDLNFNGSDQRAYFPSTYSYALVQAAGEDPSKGATLGQFLCYDIGYGQTEATQLRYAPLSAAIVNISAQAIAAIPGAPSAAACTAGAPAAAAGPTVAGGPAATGSSPTSTGGATATGAASTAASGVGATPAQLAAAAAATNATTTTISKAQLQANQAAKEAAGAAEDASSTGSATRQNSHTISNSEIMYYLLLGGVVCAVGVFVASGRRPR